MEYKSYLNLNNVMRERERDLVYIKFLKERFNIKF